MRRRQVMAVSLVATLAVAARIWSGGTAVAATVVLSLPVLGWAFDNNSGTFLVLGVLVTLVIVILVATMSLLALHR